jgi:tRNA (guanine37-N1)-methyltransferase
VRIDVITIFPELVEGPLKASLLGKAIAAGKLEVGVHDLRAYGVGRHRSVDDEPYGGGAGMVMRPEPIFEAVDALRGGGRGEPVRRLGAGVPPKRGEDTHVVLLSPRGTRLDQEGVARLAERRHLILVCGRYEGVDERVAEHLADAELSIGDYVLAGGELPALVVIEAVSRLVPGVVGNVASLESESYSSGLLEYPQYTRPEVYRGHRVPEVLRSGDHGAVERWRRERAEELTRARRPDLLRRDD